MSSTKKKIEYLAKRIAIGPTISALPSQDYGFRFQTFISQILKE